MAPSTSSIILYSLFIVAAAVPATPFNVCPHSTIPRRPGIRACKIQCFAYDPVCGANGVTYGCGCPEASCNGVRVIKKGPCTPPPPPPTNNICGKGSTGSNCEAIRCLVADPMCGVNGVTYACGCVETDCFGINVAYKGQCV